MAQQSGLSQSTISRIWRAFALQPHRTEGFQLSKDPLFFIDKVRDIVGIYLNPPESAVVLCVDEKAQIQALDHTAPLLPMRPGQVERYLEVTNAGPRPFLWTKSADAILANIARFRQRT